LTFASGYVIKFSKEIEEKFGSCVIDCIHGFRGRVLDVSFEIKYEELGS